MSPPLRDYGSLPFYRWAIVLMLFPVALLNYLDRMMVATMRSSIRTDIPTIANDADFALVMALFMWVYAFLSPVGGFVADRFNRRRIVIMSLFVWSVITCATGYCRTFHEMACARALMGISEAFYIPAALALISDFHPGPTRSRAIGIHTSGIYAGQALGGLGGYIADTSSWRNAFYIFGAAGILYSVVLIAFLKETRQVRGFQSDCQNEREPVRVGSALRALLGTGAFIILIIYFTLPAVPGWAIKNWLPTFLASAFNLRQGPAGMSATGYVTVASLLGALVGGVLADGAMRVTNRGRVLVSAMAMLLLCVPALLCLGNVTSLGIAIVAMVLFGLGFGIFDANNMPILCQIIRPEYRATGYGIMNFVSIGTGAGVTVAMGAMRDHGISLHVAFKISALVAAVGGILILCIKPRPDSSTYRRNDSVNLPLKGTPDSVRS
jgi:MFS family permease